MYRIDSRLKDFFWMIAGATLISLLFSCGQYKDDDDWYNNYKGKDWCLVRNSSSNSISLVTAFIPDMVKFIDADVYVQCMKQGQDYNSN